MTIIAVVHVGNIFVFGLKSRCDRFRDELSHLVPIKNLGKLRWFGGCHCSQDRERGILKIAKNKFADELARNFQVISEQECSASS